MRFFTLVSVVLRYVFAVPWRNRLQYSRLTFVESLQQLSVNVDGMQICRPVILTWAVDFILARAYNLLLSKLCAAVTSELYGMYCC